MEFSFKVTAELILDHKNGSEKSTHVATNINIDPSDNLDKSRYLTENGTPTKEGSKVMTNVLIQALVGNIHAAEKEGFIKSPEHLRFIISELERGFASIAEVGTGTF